jgi:hypothetical protein
MAVHEFAVVARDLSVLGRVEAEHTADADIEACRRWPDHARSLRVVRRGRCIRCLNRIFTNECTCGACGFENEARQTRERDVFDQGGPVARQDGREAFDKDRELERLNRRFFDALEEYVEAKIKESKYFIGSPSRDDMEKAFGDILDHLFDK